jgi:hypothetical protein
VRAEFLHPTNRLASAMDLWWCDFSLPRNAGALLGLVGGGVYWGEAMWSAIIGAVLGLIIETLLENLQYTSLSATAKKEDPLNNEGK